MTSKEYGELVRLAYKTVRDTEDAKDIVQDSYAAYLKHILHTPIDKTPRAYIGSIVINKCRTALTRRVNKLKIVSDYAEVIHLYPRRNSVEEEVIGKDLTAKCMEALLSSPGQSEAFAELLDCADRGDMVKAAAECGSNYDTFKANILHARKKLRKVV